jgi:prepilin-type N-terminal cleavage/methylation domain-containing protein
MIEYNRRKVDSGFTLLELLATIAISTLVFLTAAIVLSMWGIRFQQLSRIAKLHDQAYDCIQTIKHGKIITEDSGIKSQFIGVINASSMSAYGNSITYYSQSGEYVSGFSGLKFKPPTNHSAFGTNDEVTISLRQGFVTLNADVYGLSDNASHNVKLFPEDVKSKNRNIYVESLVFAPLSNSADPDDLEIVRVILKAKIELSDGNSELYSAYPNPYTVEYETFIAIDKRKE